MKILPKHGVAYRPAYIDKSKPNQSSGIVSVGEKNLVLETLLLLLKRLKEISEWGNDFKQQVFTKFCSWCQVTHQIMYVVIYIENVSGTISIRRTRMITRLNYYYVTARLD